MHILRTILHVSICVLLFGTFQSSSATSLDFEGLSDGDVVTTQFSAQGVTVSHSTVLTAGVSLDEFEFPPHSGSNVVVDEGGPMLFSFTMPVFSFGG